MLMVLALINHYLSPIKKELAWYVLVLAGGAVVELALVNYAGAWSYSTKHFMGIPIWMPLFWGNIGITIIAIYEWFKNV